VRGKASQETYPLALDLLLCLPSFVHGTVKMLSYSLEFELSSRFIHAAFLLLPWRSIHFPGMRADIDECMEVPIPICPPGSDCLNGNGTYRCLEPALLSDIAERCELGYHWNSTQGRCTGKILKLYYLL
jgi:hypothetical protein